MFGRPALDLLAIKASSRADIEALKDLLEIKRVPVQL